MAAAMSLRTGSLIAVACTGTNTAAAGRAAMARSTSVFCSATSSGFSGT
jgi:hypothetical protein